MNMQRKSVDSENNDDLPHEIMASNEGSSLEAGPSDSTTFSEQTPLLISSRAGLPPIRSYVSARERVISPVISEDDNSITIRQPMTYSRRPMPTGNDSPSDLPATAFISRKRYYDRLAPYSNSSLMVPNHLVPQEYYLVIPITIELGKQSSIITIFSIWNTMMGTSILSMPWAIGQAGFSCGIVLMIVMAGLTMYTAYRIMVSPQSLVSEGEQCSGVDFSNVCRRYLGPWAEISAIIFSLISLLGAIVVYWVLMSNFLYNSVSFVHDKIYKPENMTDDNSTYSDVQCAPNDTSPADFPDTVFYRVWRQTLSVPFFLVVFLFPLVNFKSPTFFTKFNSLGTISVFYILIFVCIKAAKWGFHLDFSSADPLVGGIPQFQPTFPALTGILSLAYYIHNAIISIVRNQRHPENNGRDLTIAYVLVACTYLFVGIVFYSSFPLEKKCLADNLLNNLRNSDVLAFVARIFLFFQMITVFPLLMFIFRIQILGAVFGSIYPSLKHVLLLNSCLIGFSILMAIFLPHIGKIIGFTGSLCGLVYVFALPSLVYIVQRRRSSTLTVPILIVHGILIVFGVLNFVAQFAIMAIPKS